MPSTDDRDPDQSLSSAAVPARHPTLTQTYLTRAFLPGTPPLTSYLLRLIAYKQTNLCLSADVGTSAELLAVADELGDSICVLKTHCDIVADWTERTARALVAIARRRRFLIFEDRKFGDIGSTVQKQYAAGPLRIASWAELTNAHVFPGPAIITALKEAADQTIAAYNTGVHTEISAEPRPDDSDDDDEGYHHGRRDRGRKGGRTGADDDDDAASTALTEQAMRRHDSISQNSRDDDDDATLPAAAAADRAARLARLERLGPAPYVRGLLLVAQMSSAGSLCAGAYTEACVGMARRRRDFVVGFIAQEGLNAEEGDNFVSLTPGVGLAPAAGGAGGAERGGVDGLGQLYVSPRTAVLERGSDVVIVGRGILGAKDRRAEAERYREEAWRAYEERVRSG
ncbi:Orotidine 5'-phosphate decarboxylase domain-containing protein [Lineolata rhizophorae]|uniref:Orotidine 5'-phosphate decarboxylase n=1 Tax=Lineolata rhizophorae TaxID=578093 RepID=A0A6A6PD07_9PEZI|nr:Orotidine 5'-phosphate decarboxylase domain-containing protein [Lineolata rhizophorae]